MKKSLIWILALLLTLAAAIYQKKTGPTYPFKATIDLDGQEYTFNLPRSHAGKTNCPIHITIADSTMSGYLLYRRYPTNDNMQRINFERKGLELVAQLPHQPVAGKLEYQLFLMKEGVTYQVRQDKLIVIRFRGEVPAGVMIPHILFMFAAMLLANAAGFFALFKFPVRNLTTYTLVLLFLGGLIFGPIVQKYAFNEYWAGIPFAWDLTDNKTLIAFIFWLVAWFKTRKECDNGYVIVAMLVTLIIFSIPHSMYGSELDHESGTIIQGNLLPFIRFW